MIARDAGECKSSPACSRRGCRHGGTLPSASAPAARTFPIHVVGLVSASLAAPFIRTSALAFVDRVVRADRADLAGAGSLAVARPRSSADGGGGSTCICHRPRGPRASHGRGGDPGQPDAPGRSRLLPVPGIEAPGALCSRPAGCACRSRAVGRSRRAAGGRSAATPGAHRGPSAGARPPAAPLLN